MPYQKTDVGETSPNMSAEDSSSFDMDEVVDAEGEESDAPGTEEVAGAEKDDSSSPETDKAAPDVPVDTGPAGKKPSRQPRSISFSVRSLAIAVVIALAAVALGTMTWLYITAQGKLDEQARASDSDTRAEKIALQYAVKAATMDFKDLQGWKVNLVAGTSQELNNKLSDAAKSMEQILSPLQWSSTAEPLVAKVRSRNGGVIVVDCFVSVQTKTVQAPDPLQSTATYSVTINSNDNWLITDVGGIGSPTGPK